MVTSQDSRGKTLYFDVSVNPFLKILYIIYCLSHYSVSIAYAKRCSASVAGRPTPLLTTNPIPKVGFLFRTIAKTHIRQ